MTKTDKKIISIFLLLIMIIAQLSPVFAADYAGQETTKTLTQYLIENGVDGNGDGVLSDAEWAKVKNLDLTNVDLTGIEKAVNLKRLYISEGCNLDNVDFSKLVNLETLMLSDITLTVTAEQNLGKAVSLLSLNLYNCTNYAEIPYGDLNELAYLDIYSCCETQKAYVEFPKMGNLKSFSFMENEQTIVDITKLDGLNYLYFSGSSTIKLPKFKDLQYVQFYANGGQDGVVDVDGILDLELCENVQGTIYIDSLKIKLSDNTMMTRNYGKNQYELNFLEDEIEIFKSDKEFLVSGRNVYDLVSNTNANIAVYNTESIYEYEEGLIYNARIEAKNVGTTDITLKDILGKEKTIKVKVYDTPVNDVNTELENSGITAEFVDTNKILKSNGELWDVNSNTTAEKIDTNVKDYVSNYVYVSNSYYEQYVSNTLKNDGTLTINYEGYSSKKIANVQQIEDNVYLTNDGKLYELGLNYITEEINPKLIKENVKKLIKECIVLEDGTTWYQVYSNRHSTSNVTFEKLADFEIKDMSYYEYFLTEYTSKLIPTVIDNDNNLWCCSDKSYYFNTNGLEKLQGDYAGYEVPKHIEVGSGIDGIRILDNGNAVSTYYSDEDGKTVDGETILTSVAQTYYNYSGDGHILIRTDGTIWTFNNKNGLTKITKSTSFDDEEEEKEFLTPTTQVNSKELGTSTMISGISNNTNVQNFMKQNNFNNAYQAKIFDKNNNEITGESLLGTGSTVKLYEDGKVVKEYVVVIYGDTTGDGKITAVDALAVIKHINNKILFTKEAYSEAGRVRSTSGNSLTSVDALAIIKGVNGKFTINQDK